MGKVAQEGLIGEILKELVQGRREAAAGLLARAAGDWGRLLGEAASEGVANLLFYFLKRGGLLCLIPPEAAGRLGRGYFATLQQNLLFAARLRPLFTDLSERAIPFLVLKGLALAELVYPAFGIRGTSDVDLLVPKEDMGRIDALLSERGYLARDASLPQALANPFGYLASLDYHRPDGLRPNIHVHWHLVNTSVPAYMFAGRIDLDRLWQRSWPATVAGASVRVPCPEHLVIYLAEHGLRVNHSFDRLILLYDLLFVVRKYRIDWDFLMAEAARFGLEGFVYFALTLAKKYTPLAIPAEINREIQPVRLSAGERLFLRLQRERRRRGSSILIYLAMNQGLGEKARFLFRTFFPPPGILLQRRYQREGSLLLAYLKRAWEVLSHLGGIVRRG